MQIAGGQGKQHASFADAAKMTLTNMQTQTAYWEAALPGIPNSPGNQRPVSPTKRSLSLSSSFLIINVYVILSVLELTLCTVN